MIIDIIGPKFYFAYDLKVKVTDFMLKFCVKVFKISFSKSLYEFMNLGVQKAFFFNETI